MDDAVLSGAVTTYLLEKAASGRSPHTLADYRNYLRLFVDHMGDPSLRSITTKDINDFMNWAQVEYKVHRAGVETNATLSPKSISNIQAIISGFWKWAAENYRFSNPCKISWKKAALEPIDPLTEEEVIAIMHACDDPTKTRRAGQRPFEVTRRMRKRDHAIVLALLDTGCRATELCEVKIGDMDFDQGRIRVTGKGRKARFVYLGRKGKAAVWSYLMDRFPRGKMDPDAWLFLDSSGYGPLNRDSLRNLLLRLGKRARVKNPHPHRFRHTFAVEYLRNGGDVFTLQQLLGHTTLTMVSRYVQLAQVDMKRVHQKANPSDNWRVR